MDNINVNNMFMSAHMWKTNIKMTDSPSSMLSHAMKRGPIIMTLNKSRNYSLENLAIVAMKEDLSS